MRRLIVNYENNAPDFWDGKGGDLWTELCDGERCVQDVTLPDVEAEKWMERFRNCDGWEPDDWNGSSCPVNLPILVVDVD